MLQFVIMQRTEFLHVLNHSLKNYSGTISFLTDKLKNAGEVSQKMVDSDIANSYRL